MEVPHNRDDSGRGATRRRVGGDPHPGPGRSLAPLGPASRHRGARAGRRGGRRCGQAGWEEGRRREAGRKVCWAAEAGTPAGDARRPERPQPAWESCSPWVSGDRALPAGEPLRPQPRAPRAPLRPSRVGTAGPGWALGGDASALPSLLLSAQKESEPRVLFPSLLDPERELGAGRVLTASSLTPPRARETPPTRQIKKWRLRKEQLGESLC